jgi:hypothetical protein
LDPDPTFLWVLDTDSAFLWVWIQIQPSSGSLQIRIFPLCLLKWVQTNFFLSGSEFLLIRIRIFIEFCIWIQILHDNQKVLNLGPDPFLKFKFSTFSVILKRL